MTGRPSFFDWLLRRSLPGEVSDAIRGDLLEELHQTADRSRAHRRYRRQVLSVVWSYAMQSLLQDLRFTFRSFAKRPAFAVTVATMLALGIGANTAIFSILNALVLRTLPVTEPERLVIVSINQLSQPYPLFRYLQEHATTLDGLLAFRTVPVRLTSGASTERASAALVSGNYFQVLGVQAALGTTIVPDDDLVPGSGGRRGPVAVVSHGFWERRLGARPNAIGEPVVLNGRHFTIVGVAPREFVGTEVGQMPDVFVPVAMQPVLMPSGGNPLEEPRNNWIRLIGRLASNVDTPRSEAELTNHLAAYAHSVVKETRVKPSRVTLLPGAAGISGLRSRFSMPLAVVMAVMVLVLLIACANIANLTLIRTAARRRELAIRLSLGASHGRVIRQLLTESAILAAVGGAMGLLVARWGRDVLLTYVPTDYLFVAPMDRGVLLFTLGISVAAALLVGLVPAMGAANLDVAPILKAGAVSRASSATMRRGLVVFQVSVSLVIIIGAVLFTRTLDRLISTDTGFARQNVLVATADLPADRSEDVYPRLLERLRNLPGVMAVAAADAAPLGASMGWNVYVPGYVPTGDEPRTSPWVSVVSPGYFDTMGVPVLRGRGFEDGDLSPTRNVMVVNETFARHYFAGNDPVGRRIGFAEGVADVEIVGIVKDVRYTGVREDKVRAVYVPFRPGPWASTLTLHLRTRHHPGDLAASVRAVVRDTDPYTSVSNIRTVEEEIGRSLLRERLVATVTTLFAGLALALALVGLYGVLSYGVAQRSRELGIRVAIGATTGSIQRLVLREAGWVVGMGLAIGLCLSWALSRVVRGLLFGIDATEPVSAAIAVGVLGATATVAAWLPARRASRVDPIQTLRHD